MGGGQRCEMGLGRLCRRGMEEAPGRCPLRLPWTLIPGFLRAGEREGPRLLGSRRAANSSHSFLCLSQGGSGINTRGRGD